MARDYRHGVPRRKAYKRSSQLEPEVSATSAQIPGWFWMVALVFLLVFGYAALKHFTSADLSVETQSPAIYQNASKDLVEQELEPQPDLVVEAEQEELHLAKDKVESYSFYVDLAEAKVLVDVEPISVELPEPVWLQVGSFREPGQAMREKQRLATVGLEVEIRASESNRGTYYRIVSGPYTNKLELNQLRNRFHRMGADTQIIKQ